MPSLRELREVARLSIPSGLQQLVTFVGVLALYKILGLLGTAEVAAASVMVNLSLVAILPAMGLGLAATTLVGQALGKSDPTDAERWGWDVVRVALVLMCVLGVSVTVAPRLALSIFLQDPATLDLATWPTRIMGLNWLIEGVSMVLMYALLGAGDVRRVLAVAVFFQFGLSLPLAYLFGPVLGYGLLAVWISGAAVRLVQALIFAAFWHGGRWKAIEV